MTASSPVGSSHYSPLAGVLCGIGAGALWGLVFLAPALVANFSPLELTIGRYTSYGLISLLLIAPRWQKLRQHITRREWLALAALAFTGNTLYYILLSSAVQLGGIAMTSLVIGFLPVTITIIGSRERDALALSKLLPSLLFCTAGAICIGWQVIAQPSSGSSSTQLLGLLCAIGALVSWSYFAVSNSRALTRLRHVSVHDWNLLTGVMTGLQSLVLIPLAVVLYSGTHNQIEWLKLIAVSAGLAILASIIGNGLWNRMSRLLPLTMVGQMILFETLFALIYGFVWEQRLPIGLEVAAFTLVALSVISCIKAHRVAQIH